MAKGEGLAKGWLENEGWGEIPGINPTLATVLNGTTDVVVLAPRASWQLAKATGNVTQNFAKTLSRQAKNMQRIASNPELAERMAEHYWKVILDASKNAGNAAKNTAKALGKGETYTNFARSAWHGTKQGAKTAWQKTKNFAKGMKTGEYLELPKKQYIKPEIRHYENGVLILPKPTVVYEQGVPIISVKNSPVDNWASIERPLGILDQKIEQVMNWIPDPSLPDIPIEPTPPSFPMFNPETGKFVNIYTQIPEKEGTAYLTAAKDAIRKYLKSDDTHYKFLHTTDPGTGRYFTEIDYQTFLKEWEDIMNNTFYVPGYNYHVSVKNKGFKIDLPPFEDIIGGTNDIDQMGVTMFHMQMPDIPIGVSIRYPNNYQGMINSFLHELTHASFGGIQSNDPIYWAYKFPVTSKVYQANKNTLAGNSEYRKMYLHPQARTKWGQYAIDPKEIIADARAYNVHQINGNNHRLKWFNIDLKKLSEEIIGVLPATYLGIKTIENEKENQKNQNSQ